MVNAVGATPLHFLIARTVLMRNCEDFEQIASFMIDHGADPIAVDDDCDNCLHLSLMADSHHVYNAIICRQKFFGNVSLYNAKNIVGN